MKLVIRLIASTIAVFAAAYLTPGVTVPDLKTALLVAIVLGLLNVFVKPILHILTLPITIITLGLFSLIISALLVLVAAEIVPGFLVESFLSAVIFGFLVSLIQAFFNALTK